MANIIECFVVIALGLVSVLGADSTKTRKIQQIKNDDLTCYQPRPPAEIWLCYNKDIDIKDLVMSNPTEIELEVFKDKDQQDTKAGGNNKAINEKLDDMKPLEQYLMLRKILKRIDSKSKPFGSTRVKKRPFDSISYGSVFGGFG